MLVAILVFAAVADVLTALVLWLLVRILDEMNARAHRQRD